MFVNIQIPDEVYTKYAERNPQRPQAALADTLKEFVDRVPGKNRLILEDGDIRKINGVLEYPMGDAEGLLRLITRLKRVGLGEGIDISLTQAQLERLKSQSFFMKQPSEGEEPAFRRFVAENVQRALATITGL